MTITELKETFIQMGLHAKINYFDEIVCVYGNETAQVDDWFIAIPFDALLFFHVDTTVEAAVVLDGEALAKVEAVVSLFLVTPEEERGIYEAPHAAKKYTIPMPGLQTSNGGQQFLSEKDGNYITATEAHEKTQAKVVERRAFELKNVYDKIREAVNSGRYRADYIASNSEIGDYIFNHLVMDDYYVEMQSITDGNLGLSISWEDVEDDPDRRYILLMDDTRNEFGQVCVTLHHGKTSDSWIFKYVNNMSEAINFDYTVTARDLEDAPDWVKAIEPIEVKE